MYPLLKTQFQKSSKYFFRWWIQILFFGLPLVWFSESPQGYEIVKFIFWEIWWSGYLFWLVSSGELKNLWKRSHIGIIFGWIFVFILGITSLQGGRTSLLGSIFRKQGWIFFFQLWIFFLGLRGKRKELFSLSIQGLGLSTLILAGIGIWEKFIGWARVGGSFGEPNALGGYLAVIFPLLLNNKWWLGGILAVVGVYLTESRSTAAALAVIATVILIGKIKSLKISMIQTGFITGIIISTFFFIWNWKDLRISYQDNRLGIWKMSISAILARPFTGYGVDNIEGILNNFAVGEELGMKGLIVDRAHSLFLDLWLWSGVLGVIGFVGFVGGIIWEYIKKDRDKNWVFIASIAGFFVFSAFNPVSIPMWILFYWELAMIAKA